jgi:hypothetical protein
VLAHEQIRRKAFWPVAEPCNGDDLASTGPDHDGRNAGEVHFIRMQHRQRHSGAASRIDRIAAGLEDREAGRRREIVSGRNSVPASVQCWAHATAPALRGLKTFGEHDEFITRRCGHDRKPALSDCSVSWHASRSSVRRNGDGDRHRVPIAQRARQEHTEPTRVSWPGLLAPA